MKIAGGAGAGIIAAGMCSCKEAESMSGLKKSVQKNHQQRFNMSGYAAPKIETVRIGIIGTGRRGLAAVKRLILIDGLEIRAICDLRPQCVDDAQKVITNYGLPAARTYSGHEDSWKAMCESADLDLIYIVTPWHLHTPMAVYAMEHGKHAATEVPAAVTIDECWQLVETSEKTRKHCMMLENCCYDFFELLTLNMARQGFFGEIVHGEGAYIHYSPPPIPIKPLDYANRWRMIERQGRSGNTYPTHGLGPICQVMNINRGDKLDYMTSMSCNDFIMGNRIVERAKTDDFYRQFDPKTQIGNVNTSIIRTSKGKTIMLQHATLPPRVYSRIHMISGTNGSAQKYPLPGKIASSDKWFTDEEMNELSEKYTPAIVKRIGEMAQKVGGHGGMDFIMDWRLIDCLRNGLSLDQDVYDAALWSSIGPLSDWSVANHSNSIQVPDFTCGSYLENVPVDITMSKGGNTGLRHVSNQKN